MTTRRAETYRLEGLMKQKKKIFKSDNFTSLLDFAAFYFEGKTYHIIYDISSLYASYGGIYYCDLHANVGINNIIGDCLHIKYLVNVYGFPSFDIARKVFEIKNGLNNKIYVLPISVVQSNSNMTILEMIGENDFDYTNGKLKENITRLTISNTSGIATANISTENTTSITLDDIRKASSETAKILAKKYFEQRNITNNIMFDEEDTTIGIDDYKKSRNITISKKS